LALLNTAVHLIEVVRVVYSYRFPCITAPNLRGDVFLAPRSVKHDLNPLCDTSLEQVTCLRYLKAQGLLQHQVEHMSLFFYHWSLAYGALGEVFHRRHEAILGLMCLLVIRLINITRCVYFEIKLLTVDDWLIGSFNSLTCRFPPVAEEIVLK
jgi:hypothetical protein